MKRKMAMRENARFIILGDSMRPNDGVQLRRAISIQAETEKDYLRSMLSRRQLQGFAMRRPMLWCR